MKHVVCLLAMVLLLCAPALSAERISCQLDRVGSGGDILTQYWPIGWLVTYDIKVLDLNQLSKGIDFDLVWTDGGMVYDDVEWDTSVWSDTTSVTYDSDSLTWLHTGTSAQCTTADVCSGVLSFVLTETPDTGVNLGWGDDRKIQRCAGQWVGTGTIINPPGYTRAYGDMNCDGAINSLDIDPFVTALTSAGNNFDEYYDDYPYGCGWLADCNEDGSVNSVDIDPFIDKL